MDTQQHETFEWKGHLWQQHQRGCRVFCTLCGVFCGEADYQSACEMAFLCGTCTDRVRLVSMRVKAVGRRFHHTAYSDWPHARHDVMQAKSPNVRSG